MIDRLRSVARLACVAWLCGGASPRPTPSRAHTSASAFGYTRERVADGIYTFVANEAYGAVVSGNSTLIVGDSAALVIDTGHFPDLTRRMIDEVRTLTNGKPVQYVVNTHWHPDHWLGNAAYLHAYPGLTIVSTEFTRTEIRSRGPRFLGQYKDTTLVFGQLRKLSAPAATKDTSIAQSDARAYYAASLPDFIAGASGWLNATIEAPTLTFDRALHVHLGNRDVDVRFLGRANTSGDAIVFDAKTRTLVTGDLVVAPIPYAFSSFFPEWIAVLSELRTMNPAVIVPGHGAIQHDFSYINRLSELLSFVSKAAAEAARHGKTLAEFRAALDLSPFEKQFAGDDPRLQVLFRLDWTVAATKRAYDEAKVYVE
jgi:cyclase